MALLRLTAASADGLMDLDVHDGRTDLLDGASDGAGVGIEQSGVIHGLANRLWSRFHGIKRGREWMEELFLIHGVIDE
jgi:hypothetical protein